MLQMVFAAPRLYRWHECASLKQLLLCACNVCLSCVTVPYLVSNEVDEVFERLEKESNTMGDICYAYSDVSDRKTIQCVCRRCIDFATAIC